MQETMLFLFLAISSGTGANRLTGVRNHLMAIRRGELSIEPHGTRETSLKCREISSDVQDEIAQMKAEIEAQTEREESGKSIRDPLPPTTKAEIFRACFLVSGFIGSAGFALRKYAASKLQISGADPELIRKFTSFDLSQLEISFQDVGVAVGVGLTVTLLRQITLQLWEEYQWATDRSNEQVLRPLNKFDLLWVAALPGISEELLFRGGLIPAVFPDWRGVLIGALTFGVLHNSGGRNLASAAFATIAGGAYGVSFLATKSLLVPMGAHTLSNLLSALLWLQAHPTATAYAQDQEKGPTETAPTDTALQPKTKNRKGKAGKRLRKNRSKESSGFGNMS
eukprot:CAMPEP_0114497424 /NCGR_PEP_ID=MMETSP0109-20121206/6319_1 /TAXON_ID=29199 /ORGANISM="Chlorarachnion reptans, Strain CCCM449" /LENGTH=338 /DNA_ID=CAMNT_0001674809 /DNA_START=106 /DNA_END=1122 /DNA_ORIENTATION=+